MNVTRFDASGSTLSVAFIFFEPHQLGGLPSQYNRYSINFTSHIALGFLYGRCLLLTFLYIGEPLKWKWYV